MTAAPQAATIRLCGGEKPGRLGAVAIAPDPSCMCPPTNPLRRSFDPVEFRRYLLVQAGVFWGLILLAWLTYPAEHRYSIRTHTFSFLGSPNAEHHPRLWWVFSAALVFWGLSEVPVLVHLRRAFARLSRLGAAVGTSGLLVSCLGLVLVGWFPDARDMIWAGIPSARLHNQAALVVAAGSGFGLAVLAVTLVRGWIRARAGGAAVAFPLRQAAWALGFWFGMSGTCVSVVLCWEHRYAVLKTAARAAGTPIGSSWAEGLKTWYAFPLWENLAVYTLYIGLAWLAWAVAPARDVRSG